MFLMKDYGRSVMTGGCALLMVFSMVISESLVSRTFGTYVLQAFDVSKDSLWVPALGVGLIGFAFVVNVATNELISRLAIAAALLKVGGVLIFALVTLAFARFSFQPAAAASVATPGLGNLSNGIGFIAAVALGILAYKGFTTITNSGAELVKPKRNLGRAIVISLAICVVVYLLVAWAVGSTLSIDEIAAARDYSLAEASRPALGRYGNRQTGDGLRAGPCRHGTTPGAEVARAADRFDHAHRVAAVACTWSRCAVAHPLFATGVVAHTATDALQFTLPSSLPPRPSSTPHPGTASSAGHHAALGVPHRTDGTLRSYQH